MHSPVLQQQSTSASSPTHTVYQPHPIRFSTLNPSKYHHSPIDHRGAIQKRTLDRPRSVSSSQADRLHQYALEQQHAQNQLGSHQQQNAINTLSNNALGLQWLTPQHSPQPGQHSLTGDQSSAVEHLSTWAAPTPPRSDSGVSGAPTVSVDANNETIASSSVSTDYRLGQPTASVDMSSLGFLLPSQYGNGVYEAEPTSYAMDQSFIPPMRTSQATPSSGLAAYSQTISSSPSLYQSRTLPSSGFSAPNSARRYTEHPSNASDASFHNANFRRMNSNPYESHAQQQTGEYAGAGSHTIPSISGLTQSPIPSPSLASPQQGVVGIPQYNANLARSPNLYDSSLYSQTYNPNATAAPSHAHLYSNPHSSISYPPPYLSNPMGTPNSSSNPTHASSSLASLPPNPSGGGMSSPTSHNKPNNPHHHLGTSDPSIRVLNQRPKPQCWEHGCNGRQFSTFSNLLRHQREKSGTAAKSYCPKCGAEFTRTTARNGHLAHDKCTKQRRESEEGK